MESVDEWMPCVDNLLDRMIHLYGESNTGKSFIIRHLMRVLQDRIKQIQVYAPTNAQNHTYDAHDEVPSVFIHTEVKSSVLESMWARQECMRATYDRANKFGTLRRLALLTGDRDIAELDRKLLPPVLAMEAHKDDKSLETEGTNCKMALLRTYKQIIFAYKKQLREISTLTADEIMTIKYLTFNPRILLIFDDCTDQLQKANSAIMQKLFYQQRHLFITTIMACHTDKTFPPELKKQVFVNIFTAPECASTYIDRASTGMDKAAKAFAHSVKNRVFVPTLPHQKLVWDRLAKKYYKYTAIPVEVRFCSRTIREYATAVQKTEDEVLRGNRYANKFM